MAFNPTVLSTKAPNLPIATSQYDQAFFDQILNAFRLYFTQIDNFTGAFAVTEYGSTSQRPAVNLRVGQQFFDQTLNIPVWWSGKHWVNSSGTTV
jgi:hypothetical protein